MSRRSSDSGFVVLGILIFITLTFVTAVVIGKVIHRNRFRVDPPVQHRELRTVPQALDVRYGSLRTATLPAGSTVWVHPTAGQEVAVFEPGVGRRVIGFAPDSLLPRPAPGTEGGAR